MCYLIQIEDLVSNALIELINKRNIREVSLHTVEKYGEAVIKYLNKHNDKALLMLSRDRTNSFIQRYENFFELKDIENSSIVILKDNITEDDLIKEFRGYLSLDVLMAFVNEECVKALIK